MARLPGQHPTDREMEILQVLWDRQDASLGEIREVLSKDRPVAATTIASMLKIMSDKGQVERTPARRWKAIVTRSSAGQGLLDRLLNTVFDGSAQRLVAHLVESHTLSPDEIKELKALLEHHSKRSTPTSRR